MLCIGNQFSVKVLQFPLLLIIFVISRTRGEFRFCHYGPQKFKNSDCPYGILFEKPVPASCVYYANDQTGPSGEAELQTCHGSGKSLPPAGERLGKRTFQGMFMDISDANEKGELGNIGSDCEAECLPDWKKFDDREYSDVPGPPAPQEEPEYDDMAPPLVENATAFHKNLTAQLFLKLLEDDPVSQLSYMRSAKLLYRSFEILRKVCHPYIPQDFTEQIYKGFMYLVLKSDEKVVDVGMLEKKEIDDALDRCAKRKPTVKVMGSICNNYTRITGYTYEQDGKTVRQPYIIKPKSFRWKKYDPFIEGAWAALDFVHGYCFPAHEPNFNYHHIYQAGLEPLFTKTIMQRWPNPPELKRGDGYWNNLLEAKDARTMMQNLDACAQAGYHGSAYNERLNRPFNKFGLTIGTPTRNNGVKPRPLVGFTGTIDEYWQWYTTNDAFNRYLKSMGGSCIKTENDLNSKRAQYDSMCTN